MSTVSGKYLKDENGNKISPITSVDTVYNGTTKLIDFFYPVGSYYETSDESFDPNTSWGGTWLRDSIGLVTVGAYKEGDYAYAGGSADFAKIVQATVGQQIGEKTHTLTTSEMPSHTHNMNIASFVNGDSQTNSNNHNGHVDDRTQGTKYPSTATGGGQAHNNVQPSVGVYRWHRTA